MCHSQSHCLHKHITSQGSAIFCISVHPSRTFGPRRRTGLVWFTVTKVLPIWVPATHLMQRRGTTTWDMFFFRLGCFTHSLTWAEPTKDLQRCPRHPAENVRRMLVDSILSLSFDNNKAFIVFLWATSLSIIVYLMSHISAYLHPFWKR